MRHGLLLNVQEAVLKVLGERGSINALMKGRNHLTNNVVLPSALYATVVVSQPSYGYQHACIP